MQVRSDKRYKKSNTRWCKERGGSKTPWIVWSFPATFFLNIKPCFSTHKHSRHERTRELPKGAALDPLHQKIGHPAHWKPNDLDLGWLWWEQLQLRHSVSQMLTKSVYSWGVWFSYILPYELLLYFPLITVKGNFHFTNPMYQPPKEQVLSMSRKQS